MEAFVERMIDEYNQLNDKFKKLGSFIGTEKFNSLCLEEQVDQREQYNIMYNYLSILRSRLSRQGIEIDANTQTEQL